MVIKRSDYADAEAIINDLKQGTLDRRSLSALLIYIREQLPHDMLRDIAHCVAHSRRDRGDAYDHIEAFASDFIGAAQQGGSFSVKPIFKKSELISTLADDLKQIGFDIDQADVEQHYDLIVKQLRDILAGTFVLLQNPNVTSCRFEERVIDEKSHLVLEMRFQGLSSGGALKIPDGMKMAVPVFSE